MKAMTRHFPMRQQDAKTAITTQWKCSRQCAFALTGTAGFQRRFIARKKTAIASVQAAERRGFFNVLRYEYEARNIADGVRFDAELKLR